MALRASCALLALTLSACGTLQDIKPAGLPESLQERRLELSEVRPAKADVMPRAFELPGKSAFLIQHSGSVAAVVLFGALGAAGNAANVERTSRELGESGAASSLSAIDARAEAQASLHEVLAAQRATNAAPPVTLKPYVVYHLADPKAANAVIDVVVNLRAESEALRNGKSRPWVGTYAMHLRDTLPISALAAPKPGAEVEALRSNIRAAFGELYGELQADLRRGAPAPRQVAWVNSKVLGIGRGGDVDRNAAGHRTFRTIPPENPDSYDVYVFQSDQQYTFGNAPEDRAKK